MTSLTSQLINRFPYSQYADSKTIHKGRDYYENGRVWDIELRNHDRRAVCLVEGNTGEYTVEIEVDAKSGELTFACDCPYAEEHFCKHMVAAALELSDYLRPDANDGEDQLLIEDLREIKPPASIFVAPPPTDFWRNKLDMVFARGLSSSKSGAVAQPYVATLLLVEEEYYYQNVYAITPCVVKARNWPALRDVALGDRGGANDLLNSDFSWFEHSEEPYNQLNPAGCLNLSSEAVNLINFLNQAVRFYGGISAYAHYFPMLAQLQIPLFLASHSRKTIRGRVDILPEPADIRVNFTRENGSLILKAELDGDTFTPGEKEVTTVTHNPPWMLGGLQLFTLPDSSWVNLLASFPITIPEGEEEFFRRNYLPRLAQSLPFKSDLLHWHEVQTDPVPRLYLRDDRDHTLRAELRFAYGDYETAASKSAEPISIEPIPDSWDLTRIHRQPETEQHFYQQLADPRYRLKRSDSHQPFGTFELRSRVHPVDFLLQIIPQLSQAGFEIYGEEKLKLGKVNRSVPTLRVNITSHIDWFDLQAVVAYGDQLVSFQEIRKAMRRGERYIKLADGSVGQIPEEWLEKYKHLWNLTSETEQGFRVSDFHLSLLDALLESDATIQAPADLPQRRERLRSFDRIASQALPKGFTGKLRPYQKHGLDWLHFLHEYRFGGILADDMGLGKTIQVLAFLQSLRERDQNPGVCLLVVPKSIIANWEREAEKFTPELRILEYLGNLRDKDPAAFDGYDVILTTYGTMLRDLEILRKYTFSYAILDESQAIKNPLSKGAKAARLLSAEHRLVMTGTPVENNTFELWSQFAFLNPGMLGSLEYFKKEFAIPIESHRDEQTAATLRKLVYPFLLRRTKELVAPELPPRTERTLYVDMEAVQKKLYHQTRERYRAQLMGLIDNQEINDVRFKILEGLLRLRQIAIHPKLVEPAYRGEAPKFEVLLDTLETLQAENHKALVFSQFVETLKLIRNELDRRNIRYEYLDGQTNNRQARVDAFQNDTATPFFLISLKAGGLGLNLTAADYVIHLDPWWNPAVEIQASDRAHRIGQERPVFVYKIITRGTVEEKILQLQEQKRALVDSIITTESGFFKSLTKEDMKLLFS